MLSNSYQYKPIHFYLFAILGTWACWFSAAILSFKSAAHMQSLELQLLILGLFPPAFTAFYLIYSSKNPMLIQEFKNKFSVRVINKNYLPIILLLFPLTLFFAILLSTLLKPYIYSYSYIHSNLPEMWSTFTIPSEIHYLSVLLIILIPFLEEVAWRGYGVDSLRSKFNLFTTSIVFAVLWVAWHFPLLFINHWDTNPFYICNFFLILLPLSFLINWIYYKNNRSIIVAIILHFFIDLAELVLKGDYVTQILMTIILIFASVVVILMNKDLFFNYKWR